MCVCVHVCACVCACTCVCVRVCVCMRACVCSRMRALEMCHTIDSLKSKGLSQLILTLLSWCTKEITVTTTVPRKLMMSAKFSSELYYSNYSFNIHSGLVS